MFPTLANITPILFTHLSTRAASENEKLLLGALTSISFDINRVQYYVEGNKVFLNVVTEDISSRYSREFLIDMLPESQRWMFKDYKPHLKALLVGQVPIIPDIFTTLQETWGVIACTELFDIIELFENEPVITDFDWQVLGVTKLSIETSDSCDIFTLPLIVLDYLWQIPSEDTI